MRQYNIYNLLGIDVNPIFFLDSLNQIVPCNVVVKYSVNIKNELSVMSNIRELKDDTEYIVFDAHAKPIYITTQNLDMQICDLP
jgi:hypothetical protein